MFEEADLQSLVAVNWNRKPHPNPGLAIHMVAAMDSKKSPPMPLE